MNELLILLKEISFKYLRQDNFLIKKMKQNPILTALSVLFLLIYSKQSIIQFLTTNNIQAINNENYLYITSVISFLIYYIINKLEIKEDLITNRLIQKELVNRELEKIRRRNDCSYVAINLFHNGTVAINGTHFTKMTREYEARALNKLPLSYKLESFDIDAFASLILQLEIDGTIYISDVNKFTDEYSKNILLSFHCQSVFYVALFDKKVFIGFLTFEYENQTEFNESKLEGLRKEMYFIEDLIKAKK